MELPPPGLWTIPSGRGLSARLAETLHRLSPQELTQTTLFFPYQRALKDFTHRICALSGGATWLPQLFTFKDVSLALQYVGCPAPEAVPIPPLERLGLLAQLIAQKPIIMGGVSQTYTLETALTLAQDLADMLDAAELEGASLSQLKDLVPERFSHHWQITLQFLDILSDTWPELLSSKGYANPVDALVRDTDTLIAHFESQKPKNLVIIAGSTGSAPHVRRLMKAVLSLPNGFVVLPGFEPDLNPASWSETHPQQTMHVLLKALGKTPADVHIWPLEASNKNKARRALLAQTFDPALENSIDVDALSGLSLLEADHEHEEALAIAHFIGQVLKEDSQSSVVTCIPDATISRLVKMHLKRWGIDAIESAATPLASDPLARLATTCLKYAYHQDDMVALLDILKHPSVTLSIKTHHKERLIAQLETQLLRVDSPCLNRAMLDQRIQESLVTKRFACVMRFVNNAFTSLCSQGLTKSLDSWCTGLLDTLNILTENKLSHEITHVFKTLSKASQAYPSLDHGQFTALLTHVLKRAAPLPTASSRVHLLGTLEARLVQSDVMILSCLNEGQWPAHAPDNPWLGRSMRRHLGLLDDARKQSLQAHDFWSAAAAPRVILTRSKRHQDATMVPSRFLLSLTRTLANKSLSLTQETALLDAIRAPTLINTERKNAACPLSSMPSNAMPRPRPPINSLPSKLSVSAINYLQKDPYVFYARYVLGLTPMVPLNRRPGANLFGILVHRVMENLYDSKNTKVKHETFEIDFQREVCQTLAPFNAFPEVAIFWTRRLNMLAPRLAELNQNIPPKTHIHTEIWGQHTHRFKNHTVTLCARADRVDVGPSDVTIIDYKTGLLPSDRDLNAGKALQLPLEGLILRKGGFKGIPAQFPALMFWHLGKQQVTVKEISDPIKRIQHAEQTLETLLTQFYEGRQPLIPTFQGGDFDDYRHFVRMAEWHRT